MDAFTEEVIKEIPDLQIFKAIEYFHMQQVDSSGKGVDYDKVEKVDDCNALENAIDKINDGIPALIMYQTRDDDLVTTLQWLSSLANHTVNGIKVLRCVNDTNKYKIAIYNNNQPMQTEYLTLKKYQGLFEVNIECYEPNGQLTNIFIEK